MFGRRKTVREIPLSPELAAKVALLQRCAIADDSDRLTVRRLAALEQGEPISADRAELVDRLFAQMAGDGWRVTGGAGGTAPPAGSRSPAA